MPEKALALVALLALGLAVKTGFVGMSMWLNLAFPDFIQRALNGYRTRPRRSFFLGTVNGVALVFLGLILFATKVLGLLGLLVWAGLVALIVAAFSVGYCDLGLRLQGRTSAQVGATTLLIGGAAAEAAFLAPVLGQVFALIVMLRGLGAVVSALLARRAPLATSGPKTAAQARS
ncbi:MAG: hypothetical protein HY706_01715 [Candidatus Hydrogenedentes bacterium]|nr:hypothetical protein [Candidatus Hydrogenedentota bacterium]